MAFNAFGEVLIDAATGDVLVKGFSDPALGDSAKFVVAVAAADNLQKRSQGDETEDASASVWTTRVPQPEGAPFEEGDEVIVSGLATADDEETFVWGDKKTINLKPV